MYDKDIYRTINERNLPEEGLIFDVGENFNKIKCPMCHKIFEYKEFIFYNCEYPTIGKTIGYGDEKDYKLEPKETKENTMFNCIFKISFILIFHDFEFF